MRGRRGTRPFLTVVVLAASACASPSAGAATVVGQAPPAAGTPAPCDAGYSFIANAVSSGTSYVVPPPGGVITEWRHQATEAAGQQAALRVFLPSGADYIVLAESEPASLAPSTLNAFPTRLPAPAGSRIGLRTVSGMSCGYITDAGDSYLAESPPRPVGSTQAGAPPFPSLRLNVAAVVEPDADRDLFGDESQDGCPTVASVQTDCVAPQTKLTEKPRKRTSKRRVRFEFTSSEPASTFECRIDARKPKSCTSPFVAKGLKPGRHAFDVTAIDAAGNRDPSAAERVFKVVKRRKQRR